MTGLPGGHSSLLRTWAIAQADSFTNMPDAAGPHQLAPGDLLRRKYRIERVLGEGGFGRVYAAHNIDIDIPVAIKVRRTPGPDQRLWREAKAGARLSNPHSVRVYDIEQLDDGTPYIVMERLSGQSLREYLKTHGAVAPALATRWIIELCKALEEAHRLHQIHRDIKPSNLFLVEKPRAAIQLKLLDFGLTKTLNETDDDTLTERGLVVGSPAYMSPEQVRGVSVTAQSDVWSTGVVLYEMLTGRRPFEAPTTSGILAAIMADAPVPLCEVAPHIPSAFDAVINRCLRKCARERYASAAELASDLAKRVAVPMPCNSDVTTNGSTTATLSMRDQPRAAPAARRPVWAVLALALVGVSSALGLAYATAGNAPLRPLPTQREAARSAAPLQRPTAPVFDQRPIAQSPSTPSTVRSAPKRARPIARIPAAPAATHPAANGPGTNSPNDVVRGLFRDPDF